MYLCRMGLLLLITVPLLVAGLVLLQSAQDEARPVDVVIVMGAAQWNGQPSPVLRARLDHATALYRRGLCRYILLTGGVGPGDWTSEAAVGAAYLRRQHIPAEAILVEESGHSTWDSLTQAQAQMQQHGLRSALIVSDGFHMLRALTMARDLGITAYGSPTPSSPIVAYRTTWAQFVGREVAAVLYYRVSSVGEFLVSPVSAAGNR
jgi:uncharacterized SAM-binding protein YcdF (DUF218 family)